MQPRPGMASAFLISGGAIALSGLSIDASASSAVAVGTDGTAYRDRPNGHTRCVHCRPGGQRWRRRRRRWFSDNGNDGTFADDPASFGNGGAVFTQGALVAEDTFNADGAALYGGALFAQGDLAADDDAFHR